MTKERTATAGCVLREDDAQYMLDARYAGGERVEGGYVYVSKKSDMQTLLLFIPGKMVKNDVHVLPLRRGAQIQRATTRQRQSR